MTMEGVWAIRPKPILSDFVGSKQVDALVLLCDLAFDFGGVLQQKLVESLQNQVLSMLGHGLLAEAGLLHHLVVQVYGEHFDEVVIAKVIGG